MTNETANRTAQNAGCRSRRGLLNGTGALAFATAALRMRSVLAQDGTPVATPAEPPSWLFTQTFTSGDWERTADPARFTLHLRGGLASTIGFTDRPNRDFTVMPTADLLPRLWNDPTNPPNAAIIVEDAGTQYTFLLLVTDPVYDEAGDMVTYTVSVLNAYEGDGLGAAVERVANGTLPQTFGAGAIFIDSYFHCWDCRKACRRFAWDATCSRNPLPERGHLAGTQAQMSTCYSSQEDCNLSCDPDQNYWNNWCNANYTDWCYETTDWGCIFATDDYRGHCSSPAAL